MLEEIEGLCRSGNGFKYFILPTVAGHSDRYTVIAVSPNGATLLGQEVDLGLAKELVGCTKD